MTINTKTLTSANSVLKFRCKGIYDDWVTAKGFQVDNMFSMGETTIGEVRAGVDGILSGGYVFNASQFQMFLEANSPTVTVMQTIQKHFRSNKETLPFDFSLEIPSTSKRQAFSGFLITTPAGQTAAKLLAGLTYTWQVDANGDEDIG